MKIDTYEFKPTGVDGIYVCEEAIFKAPFDEGGCNDWEKSSGKKLLEQWFKEHAPADIQEQFDIDIPTVEEVFSQKTLDWWWNPDERRHVSKQFPLFKDSDERMKEFDGKPSWWWTKTAFVSRYPYYVWGVHADGSICDGRANYADGFVPVLRRHDKCLPKKKKIKDLTLEEKERICNKHKALCPNCPLSYEMTDRRKHIFVCLKGLVDEEVEVPKEELE